MLNFIGYFSDKKLNRENEFFASFRDMNHASYACFANIFSKDMRLKKNNCYI
jgi:NADPH-dependent 7-cyano-7-deazaguanine reductase QueF